MSVLHARDDRMHAMNGTLTTSSSAGVPLPAALLLCAAGIAGSLVACGGRSVEVPEWIMPVPEGVPTFAYAATPIDERDARVGFEADLVIAARGDDPNYLLFRPGVVGVSAAREIVLHDEGNGRIQVFDWAGDYLRTIGRPGEGPGEIGRGGWVALAGERVLWLGSGRLNTWSLDGDFLEAVQHEEGSAGPVAGLDDGSFVAASLVRDALAPRMEFRGLSAQGAELRRFGSFLTGVSKVIVSSQGLTIVDPPAPRPAFAASPDGDIYVTPAAEYQLYALRRSGQMRWAVGVAWPRLPVTEEDRAAAVLRPVPGVEISGVEWPEQLPALGLPRRRAGSALALDGHGHLWVFPLVPSGWEREELPVDIFSFEGEPLFSGFTPFSDWQAPFGDFVFRVEEDVDSGEHQVVRYRLVEPF